LIDNVNKLDIIEPKPMAPVEPDSVMLKLEDNDKPESDDNKDDRPKSPKEDRDKPAMSPITPPGFLVKPPPGLTPVLETVNSTYVIPARRNY